MNYKYKIVCDDNGMLPQDMFNIINSNFNNLKIVNNNEDIYFTIGEN